MHLNNIMISVKRKFDDVPSQSNVSKKSNSRLTQGNNKLAIQANNFGDITSLNIMTGRSLLHPHNQVGSPIFEGKKNPSLTQRTFGVSNKKGENNMDILPTVG